MTCTVCDAEWAEYKEVRDAALAECEKARNQHPHHEPRTTEDEGGTNNG